MQRSFFACYPGLEEELVRVQSLQPQSVFHKQQTNYPKVVQASARSFRRTTDAEDHYHYNRPMMLNAWSQTITEDFDYLGELEHSKEQSEKEKELLEKIRVLEENLRAHSDLLSQIHATSARTTALLQYNAMQSPMQIQQQTMSSQQPSSAPGGRLTISPASLINPLQQVNTTPAESVKYTIIADGDGDPNGEPIEIHLAEEDGALNLNSSAESGRLEICLASDVDNVEVKNEYTKVESPTQLKGISTPADQQFIKRRKLVADSNTLQPQNSNYFQFHEHNVLSPTSVNGNTGNSSSLTNDLTNSAHSTLKRRNGFQKVPPADPEAGLPLKQTVSQTPSPNQTSEKSSPTMDTDHIMVSIGPNNTRIPAKIYESMNWNSASIATRKLLMTIFDRNTLATHSMTGKPSPAFRDHGKPLKKMLNPNIIRDIIFAVTRKCNVSEKEVRNAITTKCADENKMMKLQMNKNRPPMHELNKENIV